MRSRTGAATASYVRTDLKSSAAGDATGDGVARVGPRRPRATRRSRPARPAAPRRRSAVAAGPAPHLSALRRPDAIPPRPVSAAPDRQPGRHLQPERVGQLPGQPVHLLVRRVRHVVRGGVVLRDERVHLLAQHRVVRLQRLGQRRGGDLVAGRGVEERGQLALERVQLAADRAALRVVALGDRGRVADQQVDVVGPQRLEAARGGRAEERVDRAGQVGGVAVDRGRRWRRSRRRRSPRPASRRPPARRARRAAGSAPSAAASSGCRAPSPRPAAAAWRRAPCPARRRARSPAGRSGRPSPSPPPRTRRPGRAGARCGRSRAATAAVRGSRPWAAATKKSARSDSNRVMATLAWFCTVGVAVGQPAGVVEQRGHVVGPQRGELVAPPGCRRRPRPACPSRRCSCRARSWPPGRGPGRRAAGRASCPRPARCAGRAAPAAAGRARPG